MWHNYFLCFCFLESRRQWNLITHKRNHTTVRKSWFLQNVLNSWHQKNNLELSLQVFRLSLLYLCCTKQMESWKCGQCSLVVFTPKTNSGHLEIEHQRKQLTVKAFLVSVLTNKMNKMLISILDEVSWSLFVFNSLLCFASRWIWWHTVLESPKENWNPSPVSFFFL